MSVDVLVRDPALPQLDRVFDPGYMTERLAELPGAGHGFRVDAVDVLKHKAGKRCSVAYVLVDDAGRTERRFAKAFKTERGAAIVVQMRRVHEAIRDRALVVPRPVGYLPDLRLLVTEFVDGYPLAQDLYDGRSPEPARRMARAVAALHAADVRCARRWAPRKEIRNTADWLAGLAGRDPADSERAWGLLDRLGTRSDDLPRKIERPVHRDFYPDQFHDSDGRTVLLDLDDLRVGDPALDLGNFLAHLTLRPLQYPALEAGCRIAREVFLDAWLEAVSGRFEVGRGLDARIRFYEATTLVRLAGVYASRERWASTVPDRLLDACERRIDSRAT